MTSASSSGSQNVSGPSLRKLGDGDIKLISAGEKISDIETVVRELVENSIDARSRNIEVRLTKFGADCIEVCDDGTGIDEVNFESLGVRYHTSKIMDFNKLQDLETFGFRGEALSCLISLADVTITTKSETSSTGTRLEYKKNGAIRKVEPRARGNGTTVTVKKLFHSLPVRMRELEQTAKRQYDKVVKLIYEQVLAKPSIKFTLCKMEKLEKKNDFTHGGTTLESCITTIFGSKILDTLMAIRQAGTNNFRTGETKKRCDKIKDAEADGAAKGVDKISDFLNMSADEPLLNKGAFEITVAPKREEFYKKRKSTLRKEVVFTLYGYISKLESGRNASDNQFIFVNSKPCDILKVSKVVNEVYRNYTQNQSSPFLCLFIQVQTWAADFNVPRKRAVILQEENKLCELVRESLEQMYSPLVQSNQKSCPVAQIPITTPKPDMSSQTMQQGTKRGLENPHQDHEGSQPSKKQSKECPPDDDVLIIGMSPRAQQNTDRVQSEVLVENKSESNILNNHRQDGSSCNSKVSSSHYFDPTKTRKKYKSPPKRPGRPTTPITPYQFGVDACSSVTAMTEPTLSGSSSFSTALDYLISNGNSTESPAKSTSDSMKMPSYGPRLPDPTPEIAENNLQVCLFDCKFEQKKSVIDGRLQVKIDFPEELDKAIERERAQRRVPTTSREFSFSIHPKFNVVAEQELKCNLNKTSFEDMQVLGQFNRGFILARLDKHVFIIDQHATDERANFEEQLDKSPLVEQKMVHPKPLYFNSIQENAIINNLEELKKKGFQFIVDENKPAGFRVLLSATSICKGQGMDEHLTREDLEELIDVILESPNSFSSYTLKKVRSVAASRACRKSVMIGDKLSWSQMCSIVSKMSSLENPWVCAHNRPTIRHLMNIDWMDFS